jgi:hypothetical protein
MEDDHKNLSGEADDTPCSRADEGFCPVGTLCLGASESPASVATKEGREKLLFESKNYDDSPILGACFPFDERLDLVFFRVNRMLRISCDYPDSPDVKHNIYADESLFWLDKIDKTEDGHMSDNRLNRAELISISEEDAEDTQDLRFRFGWVPNPKDQNSHDPILTLIRIRFRKTKWNTPDDTPVLDPHAPIETLTVLHTFSSWAKVPRPPICCVLH